MGNLEHQFTKEELDFIQEQREVNKYTWGQISKGFSQRFGEYVSSDEIRWAYMYLT
jgi:hypothetical protein